MSDHSPKTTVKTVFKRINTGLGPFLVVIGISLFFAITTRAFLTVSNFLSLGHSASLYVLMAMGLSCVLISGGTDLSAGSVVGLCGVICALMMRDFNIPVIPSIVIALLCGTLCGLINGTLVTRLGLVPFIATLGTQWVYRGACNLLVQEVLYPYVKQPIQPMQISFINLAVEGFSAFLYRSTFLFYVASF